MDQLVEIIKVLGTPTKEEIHSMNPNYTQFKFPQIKAHPWTRVFNKRMPPDAVDLVITCSTTSACQLFCLAGSLRMNNQAPVVHCCIVKKVEPLCIVAFLEKNDKLAYHSMVLGQREGKLEEAAESMQVYSSTNEVLVIMPE